MLIRDLARKGSLVLGSILVAIIFAATPTPGAGALPREQAATTGTLRGSVRVGPNLGGRRVRVSLYPAASQRPASPDTRSLSDELANVVVYLEPATELTAASLSHSGPFRVEQLNESFLPHVLPVLAGTTVEFPNGDSIYHNAFSLSKAASFDLGRYPKGASRSVRFERPGIVKVFCHIHSGMSAVVMVLENTFFTVPRPDGSYEISGIPPGRYTVVGWHERARPIHRTFTIEPNQQTLVDLAIPLEDEPGGR